MHPLFRFTQYALSGVVAVITFAMMLITFVDVFARYLFNAPLRGAYEVIGFMLAIVVFSALPLVTWSREHITVEIFEQLGSAAMRRIQGRVVSACCGLLLAVMAWRLWVHAGLLEQGPQVTGFLELPYAPIAYFMGGMSALACVGAFVHAWRGDIRQEATS
ncbi:MAG: TRAP transporter small permease [Burkholderiaceae bacterium]